MMIQNYKSAFATLQIIQEELNKQDISVLPATRQVSLLQAQQDVYLEMQALQLQNMKERTNQYLALTEGFRQSEAGFKQIQDWAVEAQATGKLVDGLLKGISLALTLL